MYINQATIFGNIVNDLELKTCNDNLYALNFRIATNHKTKSDEKVEYHNIVAFGKAAENISKYMQKGSPIYIQGRLHTTSWEKEGKKFFKCEIHAETIKFGRTIKPKQDDTE